MISDISKLIRLSPTDAFKKAVEVIGRKISNKKLRPHDLTHCTYFDFEEMTTHLENDILISPSHDFLERNKTKIIELSKRYIRHEFNLLGSEWVNVSYGTQAYGLEGIVFDSGTNKEHTINKENQKRSEQIATLLPNDYNRIDWQIDFKTGYRWDINTWYKDIKYGYIPGPDIKIPWELGRMQHLFIIAYAAIITKDEKYLIEIRNQLIDFISSNPPRFGVQWTSTMEVGIRLANWLYVYDILKQNGFSFDDEFLYEFNKSVYDHIHHIIKNPESSVGMKANHYFANIAGLLFGSAYLSENEEMLNILDFSINEIIKETFLQFNEDGSNFEASTYYHVFVCEMLLWAILLIKSLPGERIISLSLLKSKRYYKVNKTSLEIELPNAFHKRLNNIIKFVKDISSNDNDIFRIGDDDGSYFLANIYKQFSYLSEYPTAYNPKNIYHLSESLKNETDKEQQNTVKYDDFGLYKINKADYKLLIRCGSLGRNIKGGHSHNDQLSLCLSVKGKEMIVDPGTYLYTPLHNRRNEFRSVAKHNTMSINDKEQNIWHTKTKDDLFWIIKERTKAEVIDFNENSFRGSHFAFGNECTRDLNFGDKIISGKDICQRSGNKILRFHFHPKASISQNNGFIKITRNESRIIIKSEENMEIKDYLYSPTYGILQNAKVIIIECDKDEIDWEIEIIS